MPFFNSQRIVTKMEKSDHILFTTPSNCLHTLNAVKSVNMEEIGCT